MTRPSPYIAALHQYSVNRKTSLSLQPVGHKLLAPAFTYTCTGLLTCQFTVHSEKPKIGPFSKYCHSATVPTTSVIPGFLRFKARRIGWHPSAIPAARPVFLIRVLSCHRLTGDRPSIIAPGRIVPFGANSSATQVSCWRFPPSLLTSLSAGRSPRQVSLPDQAEFSLRLDALVRFVHRVGHTHGSDMELSRFLFRGDSGVIGHSPNESDYSGYTKMPLVPLLTGITIASPPAARIATLQALAC